MTMNRVEELLVNEQGIGSVDPLTNGSRPFLLLTNYMRKQIYPGKISEWHHFDVRLRRFACYVSKQCLLVR